MLLFFALDPPSRRALRRDYPRGKSGVPSRRRLGDKPPYQRNANMISKPPSNRKREFRANAFWLAFCWDTPHALTRSHRGTESEFSLYFVGTLPAIRNFHSPPTCSTTFVRPSRATSSAVSRAVSTRFDTMALRSAGGNDASASEMAALASTISIRFSRSLKQD